METLQTFLSEFGTATVNKVDGEVYINITDFKNVFKDSVIVLNNITRRFKNVKVRSAYITEGRFSLRVVL